VQEIYETPRILECFLERSANGQKAYSAVVHTPLLVEMLTWHERRHKHGNLFDFNGIDKPGAPSVR
jgi:hypothetical protein